MSDIPVLLAQLALFALCLGIFILSLIYDRKNRMRANVLFHQSMLLGWLLMSILYLLVKDFALAAYVYDLRIPFVSFAALALLLFIFRYYGLEEYRAPTIVLLLSLVPTMTLILTILPQTRYLIRYDVQVLSTVPYHAIVGTRGMWFWIHTGYSYFLMAVTFITAVRQYRKTPVIYRSASGMTFTGLVLVLVGNIVTLLSADVRLDMTLVFACLSSAMLYRVSRGKQGMGLLHHGREGAFQDLPDAVAVLDDEGHVIRQNRQWNTLLEAHGVDTAQSDYAQIKAQLFRQAAALPPAEQIEGGVDYRFSRPGNVVCNLQEKQIFSDNGKKVGAVVICTDVTQNRARLRKISDAAGMDPLTGLLTRARMEEQIAALEQSGERSLVAVMGDVNRLKYVNDNFGHAQGDIYLRMTGEILQSSCPPNGYVARMGGDEMLMLIPRFTPEAAQAMVEEIHARMRDSSATLPYQASIALGISERAAPDEPLDAVIRRADAAMYLDKELKKEAAQLPANGR